MTLPIKGPPRAARPSGYSFSDTWRWLVGGPMCPDDPTYPAALVTRSLHPLVRAVDHPELVIRNAPIITIT